MRCVVKQLSLSVNTFTLLVRIAFRRLLVAATGSVSTTAKGYRQIPHVGDRAEVEFQEGKVITTWHEEGGVWREGGVPEKEATGRRVLSLLCSVCVCLSFCLHALSRRSLSPTL